MLMSSLPKSLQGTKQVSAYLQLCQLGKGDGELCDHIPARESAPCTQLCNEVLYLSVLSSGLARAKDLRSKNQSRKG